VDLIRLRNIQPVNASGEDVSVTEFFGTPMPDFAGQRLTDAVKNVISMGTSAYQAVGGGTIISHTWPTPGQAMPENSPVTFFTHPDTRLSERMVSVPDVVGLTTEIANFVLTEAGLPTVLITGQQTNANNQESEAVTSRAQPLGENAPPAPIKTTIYQQFPEAGFEIEQGTQVIIKAR